MRFSQNSVFRKVFVASACDFLLIFGDCATLTSRSSNIPVTMTAGLFDLSWNPHIFFQYPLLKTILTLTLFCMQSLKSLDSLFLRYPFWKDFRTVVFGLNFLHFEFFYCKKFVLLDTMVHIHCFAVQKSLLWLSKDSFLWLVQNECFT